MRGVPPPLLPPMATNLELKARVESPAAAQACAGRLGASFQGVLHQRDTYFCVNKGRLKLRECTGSPAELIWYEREEDSQERWSRYDRVEVSDPAPLLHALAGACGTLAVVEKARSLYLYGSARIHLDEVAGLGSFLEFEIVEEEPAASLDVMRVLRDAFGVRDEDVVRVSYSDLMQNRPRENSG
jgi:adenylate cyclase class IV